MNGKNCHSNQILVMISVDSDFLCTRWRSEWMRNPIGIDRLCGILVI